ncbi:MAG: capsid stabilizing protein [Thorarchaeia virus VerdaV2]|uniref:Capsid stabilizing protein n=1 Tax=Thorarchaeia virus VerdaV2 TaxID=3070171 RepID=A0AA35CNG0_9CAUD|nr:MAG: capsid stabilizing protein [Thorarchaeia virus VerdaV2]BDI54899.1 MAG: capsid stabilizing protein [Thorarchaeia virus VerdaV2]
MANKKISQISEGGIALGENKFKESQLLHEAIKAGEVVKITANGIELVNLDDNYSGVMKEHEEVDLDTDIAAGKYGDLVSEGYCAIFIENPAGTYYPGTFLYKGLGGCMCVTAMGSPWAILERTINTGDTVAIVKLLR